MLFMITLFLGAVVMTTIELIQTREDFSVSVNSTPAPRVLASLFRINVEIDTRDPTFATVV